MKPFSKIENVREMRKKLGLTQAKFWNPIGVCQSSGSRYEIGRKIPDPVCELLRIVHIEKIPLEKITRKNFNK